MDLSYQCYTDRDCEKDCQELRSSWNQVSIIAQLLARRSVSQRRQIKQKYQAIYGQNFVQQLQQNCLANPKNELCWAMYMWMLEPHERDAQFAKDAVENSTGTNYNALLEIYTRRKQNHLFFTKQAYVTNFKRHLEPDIITEPSQPYQKILVALAASNNSHESSVSQHIAKCDAKRLYETGNASSGSIEESVILEILSKRSIPQLRLALSSYKQIYGHEYIKTLGKNIKSEFENSLRVAIKCIDNPFGYYSKMIHTILKKRDGDTRGLTRLMIGSTEVGMKEVRTAFEKRYGKKLKDSICDVLLEGEFRNFMSALAECSFS